MPILIVRPDSSEAEFDEDCEVVDELEQATPSDSPTQANVNDFRVRYTRMDTSKQGRNQQLSCYEVKKFPPSKMPLLSAMGREKPPKFARSAVQIFKISNRNQKKPAPRLTGLLTKEYDQITEISHIHASGLPHIRFVLLRLQRDQASQVVFFRYAAIGSATQLMDMGSFLALVWVHLPVEAAVTNVCHRDCKSL